MSRWPFQHLTIHAANLSFVTRNHQPAAPPLLTLRGKPARASPTLRVTRFLGIGAAQQARELGPQRGERGRFIRRERLTRRDQGGVHAEERLRVGRFGRERDGGDRAARPAA